MTLHDTPPPLGLGLDAGGTATRWALADASGHVRAEGVAPGFSGVQLADAAGVAAITAVLQQVAREAVPQGAPAGVCAGVTGFDADQTAALAALVTRCLAVPQGRVILYNDIELACRAAFKPGEGILVYAGTGSVAAFIDAQGVQHRAGGRGGLIDDGGSGYWIAREALRLVWRREDEAPGAWRGSRLAQRLFEAVGGSDWSHTRAWVYGASRGQMGELALAVATAAAEGDAEALEILRGAGTELARLARALVRLHGPHPVALAGRAFDLHPCIEQALRQSLAEARVTGRLEVAAHLAAARLAAAATPSKEQD